MAGKQHAILIDKNSGIVVNHEFNGLLPQGPGETQLITDRADNSAWISIGRQLMHVSVNGDELHRNDGTSRNIDLHPTKGSPPQITFFDLRHLNSVGEPIYYFYKYYLGTPDTSRFIYFSRDFSYLISDPDGDIDPSSLSLTINDGHAVDVINYPQLLNLFHNFGQELSGKAGLGITCVNTLLDKSYAWAIGDMNGFICRSTISGQTSIIPQPDTLFSIAAQIFDFEGNASNVVSKDYIFDSTPPTLTKDLITLTFDGNKATFTGRVEPYQSIVFRNTRRTNYSASSQSQGFRYAGSDGNFTASVDVHYGPAYSGTYPVSVFSPDWTRSFWTHFGDILELTPYDRAGNEGNHIFYTLGYEIPLKVVSPKQNQIVGPTFKLTGTHDLPPGGIITATYWDDFFSPYDISQYVVQATIYGNTFTIENTPSHYYDGDHLIHIEAKTRDGGYKYIPLHVTIDATPPPTPDVVDNLYIDVTNGVISLTCINNNRPCSEPGSILHITNTVSGDFVSIETDSNGGFSALLFGKRGDLLEFYAEDAVGNTSSKITIPAGKLYKHISFMNAKDHNNSIQQSYLINKSGSYIPSYTLEEVYINIGEHPGLDYEVHINGIPAAKTASSSVFVGYNISLNPDNTIKATYKDPYGGYGEAIVTLEVDDIPPAAPILDHITITRFHELYVDVSGAPGSVEPNSLVTIVNTTSGTRNFNGNSTSDGAFLRAIDGKRGEMLSIYVTDRVGNVSEATKIPAGYLINITITEPASNGTITYYGVETVKGFHDGPPGTYIRLDSGNINEENGNNFSGIAYLNPYLYGADNPSYTHMISVRARGPNDGVGAINVYFIKEVMPPNSDLITIVYGVGNVTLIGDRHAVYPRNILTINNSRTNHNTSINSNNDGSFMVTVPAEKGDTLTLIALDDKSLEQSRPTNLELGYLVDLAITSPLNGTETLFQGLTVTGTHSGPTTSIITVNGVHATVSGNSFVATNVSVPTSGLIEVRLDDGDGAYATASITVVPDITPPPAPNLDLIEIAFSAGDSVRLRGQAGSVEAGAVLTITNTAQNESATVTVADDGSFGSTYIAANSGETLTLVATDASGNQSAPATQQLGTDVMITIDTPTAGSSVPNGYVTVAGTHQGPINSGVVVNGVIAAVTANRFVAVNVPVNADGTISATLSALNGSHGQAQISVMNLNQPVTLSLTPSSTEGVAPHTVNFEWSAAATAAPTEISIDYDGDGIFDQTTADPTLPLQHAYSAAAINNVTLRVTMPDGSVQTAETVIVTHEPDYIDAIFLSLWNGMNEALLANEPNVALNYLSLGAQRRFYVTFQVIAPNMQAVVDSYQSPARGEVTGSYIEYLVARTINGSNQIFAIYSLKGSDGIWRIDAM